MSRNRPSTLFYLALMGMELTYLYLLGSLLGGPAYILTLSLLLYPVALISKIVLFRLVVSHRLRFGLELAFVVSVILLVAGERLFSSLAVGQPDVPGILLRLGFCALTWLLGYSVPREQVNYPTIAFRLQIAVVAVLIFAQISGSTPLVFLFFLLAPLALFLARWASSVSHRAAALRSPDFRHMALSGATVMVPGIALILLFSPGVAKGIVDWLRSIFLGVSNWLEGQHEAAATPSGESKFSFGCMRPEQAISPDQGILPPAVASPPLEGAGISPIVIWIVVAAVSLAIVVLIAFALRRRKARSKVSAVEPVRFQIRMISLSMIRSLIGLLPWLVERVWLWLRGLFMRWKRPRRPPEEALDSLRALYRSLLRWAARQGVGRVPSQTPLEHLVLLEQRFPQWQNDLRLVTEAYLVARYSEQSVGPGEFDRARGAWQRVVASRIRRRAGG
jgi:hypothetical protein